MVHHTLFCFLLSVFRSVSQRGDICWWASARWRALTPLPLISVSVKAKNRERESFISSPSIHLSLPVLPLLNPWGSRVPGELFYSHNIMTSFLFKLHTIVKHYNLRILFTLNPSRWKFWYEPHTEMQRVMNACWSVFTEHVYTAYLSILNVQWIHFHIRWIHFNHGSSWICCMRSTL